MKKRLISLLLCLVMVLSCVQCVITSGVIAWAAGEVTEPRYTATSGSVTVDGDKDEAWNGVTAIDVNKGAENVVVPDGTATAKVYTLFDSDYLYILAEVTDSTPTYDIAADAVHVDVEGFNVYLDFLHEEKTGYYGEPWGAVAGAQGRIRTGFIAKETGDAVYTTEIVNGVANNRYAGNDKGNLTATVVQKQTTTGYNVEMKIKLAPALQEKLSARSAEIGICFQVNDNWPGNPKEHQNNGDKLDYPPKDLSSGQSWYREGIAWDDCIADSEWYTDGTGGSAQFPVMLLTPEFDTKYNVPYGEVQVDGKKDAAYGNSAAIDVDKDYKDRVLDVHKPDNVMGTAKVYSSYDAEWLYLYIEVMDDTLNKSATKQDVEDKIKDGEGFSVFLDYLFEDDTDYKTNPDGVKSGEQGRVDVHFIGNAAGDATYSEYPYVRSVKGDLTTKMTSVQTEVGYNVELAVKLSDTVVEKIKAGTDPVIGIGLQLNDDTTPDDGAYKKADSVWDHGAVCTEWNGSYTPCGSSTFTAMTLRDTANIDAAVFTPYNAPYGDVDVDGVKGSAYDNATVIEVNKDYRNQLYAESKGIGSALVYTVYDAEYLYFFAEVTDSTVVKNITTVENNKEGVTFFLDFLYSEDTAYKTDPSAWKVGEQGRVDVNFVGNATGDAVCTGATYTNSTKGNFEYKAIAVQTATGYNIELAVKLSETVTSKLKAGKNPVISVGFQMNDSKENGSGGYAKIDGVWDNGAVSGEWYGNNLGGSQHFTAMTLKDSYEIPESEWSPYKGVYGDETVVDGVKDAVYNDAKAIDVNKNYKGDLYAADYKGTGIGSAKVYTAYDSGYLYFFAEVTDSKVVKSISSIGNNVEGMAFFMDFLYTQDTAYKTDPAGWQSGEQGRIDVNFIGNEAGDAVCEGEAFTNCTKGDFEYDAIAVQTSTGYNVELKVKLSDSVLKQFQAGNDPVISVAFQLSDSYDKPEGGTQKIDGVWDKAYVCYEYIANYAASTFTALTLDNSHLIPVSEFSPYTSIYGDIELDGDKDTLYSNAPVIDVNKNYKNQAPAAGFGSAKVYSAFDGTYLYFFSEVTDSTLAKGFTEDQVEAKGQDGEGISFFLDFLYLEDTAYKTDPNGVIVGEQGRVDIHFIGNDAGDATYDSYPYVNSRKGGLEAKMVSKQTATGYNVELAIKLSDTILEQFQAGNDPVIGIGLQMNDLTTNTEYKKNDSIWDNGAVSSEWLGSGKGGSQHFTAMTLAGAEEVKTYTVSADTGMTGGTLTFSTEEAVAGLTVKINPVAEDGMRFDWDSMTINGQPYKGRTFVMPAENVVIGGKFVTKTVSDDNVIKVMSQNVLNSAQKDTDHGGVTTNIEDRALAIAELVNEIYPDSIGFQEIYRDSSRAWPQWLAENLTDYAYVGFGRDFAGDVENTVAEDFLNNVCSGEATPIFYRKDKYDLVEGGTRWLSETPDEASISWGASYRRIMTWVVLENKETGEQYAHINTHLDFGDEAHVKSMEQLTAFAASLQETYGDIPVVFTADWNLTLTYTGYGAMINNENLPVADSAYCLPAEELVNYGLTGHEFSGNTRGLPIDMIFITNEDAKVLSHETVHPADYGFTSFCLSDHYGVVITFDPTQATETVRDLPDSITPSDVTAYYGSATLDGLRDVDVYTGTMGNGKIFLNDIWDSEVAGANFWMAYDKEYLYIIAEVADSTPADIVTIKNADMPSNGVTFFLDFLNNAESDATYPNLAEQGILSLAYSATTGEIIQGTARQITMDHEYKIVNTEIGYNVELKVALPEHVKTALAAGNDVVIAGGLQVHDDWDNDGVRDTVAFSNLSLNVEWQPYPVGGSQCFPDITLSVEERDPNNPPTGDYGVTYLFVIATVSVAAIAAIVLFDRKRRYHA